MKGVLCLLSSNEISDYCCEMICDDEMSKRKIQNKDLLSATFDGIEI